FLLQAARKVPYLQFLLYSRKIEVDKVSGIGRMISEGFVRNGAKVYISSRDAKACAQAVKELNELSGSGSADAIVADFYKLEDCQNLAEELKKREKSGLSTRNLVYAAAPSL